MHVASDDSGGSRDRIPAGPPMPSLTAQARPSLSPGPEPDLPGRWRRRCLDHAQALVEGPGLLGQFFQH